MTEKRIDLISNELRVGDMVDIIIGEVDLRSGEEGRIPITITIGRPIGQLAIGSFSGFSDPRLDISATDEGLTGTIHVVPEGKAGEAEITIAMLTGDVGATAGLSLVHARIREGTIAIELSGIPVNWDGNEPISIPLILISRSKVKGRVEALLKNTGDVLLRTSVSFRGEHHLSLPLDPSRSRGQERMDILVRFSSGDRKEEALFNGAVVLDRSDKDRTAIPESLSAGAEMDLGSLGEDLTEASLFGKQGRIDLTIIEGRVGRWVRIPEEAEGTYTLELGGPKGKISGRVMIDAASPVRSLTVTSEKESVMSGEELHLIIDCEIIEPSRYEIRTRIGHDRRMTMSVPLDASKAGMKLSISVPPDHPPGPQPAVIEVLKDGTSVHRKVVAGFVTIMSSMSMPVSLELPGRGQNPYLFPGESVRVEGSLGPLRCLELSSGRRLLTLDGSILWGIGWKEDDTERAIGLYLTLLYRDALRDTERSRSIRQGALRQMACAEVSFSSGPDPDGEAPFVSRSCMSMTSERDLDELSEEIRSFTDSLLSGRSLLDGFDARRSARELVESVVRSLKGYGASSTSHTIAALKETLGGIEDSLGRLRKGSEDPKNTILKTLTHLVHACLLQVELSSVWTDPAISSWDDLRTLRQRYIKRCVENALDGLEALASIHTRAAGRIASLKNNMIIRRALSSTMDTVVKGTPMLKATGTGSLRGEVELVPGPLKVESDVYVLTPSPLWQLVSPLSTRDRTGLFIGRFELDRRHPFRIELELTPPQGSFSGSPVVFIRPSRAYLEAEP